MCFGSSTNDNKYRRPVQLRITISSTIQVLCTYVYGLTVHCSVVHAITAFFNLYEHISDTITKIINLNRSAIKLKSTQELIRYIKVSIDFNKTITFV